MEDPAFGKGGVYGPDYVPMAGTDMAKNDSIRYDYFDAVAGGIVGPNVAGVNCNATKEYNMTYSDNSSAVSPEQRVITGRAGQGRRYPQPTQIHTDVNETIVYQNGNACIQNERGEIRKININDILTTKEKIELFGKMIDKPEIEKSIKDNFKDATKKYICGEISRKDYEKVTVATGYILSQKKANQGNG